MQRHHKDELLAALVTGREQFIDEAAQARSTAARDVPQRDVLHEEAVREPAPRREVPAPAPVPSTNARGELLDTLTSRQALRRAILLHEVLGPPKALER